MTKVIDLTVPQGGEAKKKKIEFVGCMMVGCDGFNFHTNENDFWKTENYKHIRMVASKKQGFKYDVFQCIDKEWFPVIMLGHFNDGVV